MSNGCEYLRCEYWNGQACTDPVYWINYEGASVCGKRDDAIHTDSKISELNKRIADLEAKLQEAEKMVKNLKCCGNCKLRSSDPELCGYYLSLICPSTWCSTWQSDNMTQEAEMLTAGEKKVIAEKMGLEVFCDGRVYNYELHRFMRFDLNDAGLVRDWLVERGEWKSFRCSAEREAFDSQPLDNQQEFTAWLFATENGEATNFFRAFAKWCEEK